MLRVHRVPYSTNVERVAIAAALKGVEVDWVDHPDARPHAPSARSAARTYVPVAEFDDGDDPLRLAR